MDRNTLLLVVGGLLLLGGGTAVYMQTRGLRNNNPLNIQDDGEAWEGLDTPRNDGTFLRFVSPEYGIRAAGIIINNYVTKDGVAPTVAGITSRWSTTDQAAYAANVSSWMNVDPNATLDLSSALPSLVAAMTRMENGLNPYDDATIINGLALA
jgi:hypothetical protein